MVIDICSCKWKDFNNYNCAMDKKIPAIECEFLTDQWACRKMGSDDRPVMAILNKLLSPSLREESFASEPTSGQVRSQSMIKFFCSSEGGSTTASESSSDFEYEPSNSTIQWIINQPSRLPFVNITLISENMAVSDRIAAVLVSSILEEAGVMDEANKKIMLLTEIKLGEQRKE